MSKRQLYFVILMLLLLLGVTLFWPTSKPVMLTVPAHVSTSTTENTEPVVNEAVDKTVPVTEPEKVVIEGLFVGLDEEKTDYQKAFEFLLLDDGTEIVRIDLRPLIGYDKIDVTQKLGVDRGDRIKVTGTLSDSVFSVVAIDKSE